MGLKLLQATLGLAEMCLGAHIWWVRLCGGVICKVQFPSPSFSPCLDCAYEGVCAMFLHSCLGQDTCMQSHKHSFVCMYTHHIHMPLCSCSSWHMHIKLYGQVAEWALRVPNTPFMIKHFLGRGIAQRCRNHCSPF